MTDELATTELPSLYKAADAFVLPTRGEGPSPALRRAAVVVCLAGASLARLRGVCACAGWGLPIMEAMAMGRPVIATNWSGETMFMDERTAFPVRVASMEPAIGQLYEQGQRWAEPDVDHLRELMRFVFTHRAEAAAVARRGQEHVRTRFNRVAVAEELYRRWQEIGLTLSAEDDLVPLDPPPAGAAPAAPTTTADPASEPMQRLTRRFERLLERRRAASGGGSSVATSVPTNGSPPPQQQQQPPPAAALGFTQV